MFSVSGVDKGKLDAVFGNLVNPNAPTPAPIEGVDLIAKEWGQEALPIRPADHEGDSDYDPDAIDMEDSDEDGPCHSCSGVEDKWKAAEKKETPAGLKVIDED